MNDIKATTSTMKILLIIFSLGFCQLGFSQNYAEISNPNTGTIEVQTNIRNEKSATIGSPYLNKEWNSGVVHLKDGKVMEIEFLNFNVEKGLVSYMKNNVVYNSSQNLNVEKFQIGNQVFLSHTINSKAFFLQVLSQGEEITLLKKAICDFVAGQPSKGYIEATSDKYVHKAEYYVKKEGQEVIKIKAKKKEIVALVGDKKDEVSDFISDNVLNLKNESELIQVFDYYNLISQE
ncbi:MAG: hypothetical protein JXR03_13330 [Cyclobacteriaceae bacterium]